MMKPDAVLSYLSSRQWAMDPQRLQATADLVALTLASASPEMIAAASEMARERAKLPAKYEVRDGVAHIPIVGLMLKDVPCSMIFSDEQATSTRLAKDAVEDAALDESVRTISLDIDSPGGAIDGTKELADAVYAARDLKRIEAHVYGSAASAALWVASQAHTIEASPSSMIGSIGVVSAIRDTSEKAKSEGVKIHVVRSHELKGGPVDGAPVSDAQIAERQRVVDECTAMFVADVARGRGVSEETIRELATGQAWFAASAKDKGLIDSISSPRTKSLPIAAGMVSASSTSPRVGASEVTMADTADTAALAELQELRDKLAAAEKQAAELKAAGDLAQASLAQARANQREQLFAQYKDRITPAMKGLAETLADACGDDLAKLEANLRSLPVATRAEAVGGSPEQPTTTQITAEDEEIIELFGLDRETFTKLRGAVRVDAHTGKPVYADGEAN